MNPVVKSRWQRLAPILAALSLGCATIAMDTETDCIQRHPGMPEACGLTASEAAVIMAAGVGATGTHGQAEGWDDSHNAELPEWKRRCIRAYGDCKDNEWVGPCYECLRYCEGQHEWPAKMCSPRKRRR